MRPSLWVVKNIAEGGLLKFAAEDKENGNFDSIRPAGGLHIRYVDFIQNKKVKRSIKAGSPLRWEDIG